MTIEALHCIKKRKQFLLFQCLHAIADEEDDIMKECFCV